MDNGIWKPFWTRLPGVTKLSGVDVRRGVREDVPVQRQAYAVLLSAPARMTVIIHDCYSSSSWLLFY